MFKCEVGCKKNTIKSYVGKKRNYFPNNPIIIKTTKENVRMSGAEQLIIIFEY